MMSKITQKQAVFYKLYKARLENKEKYVPIWEFLGEILVEERGEWVFMSYKCPTRLTDIYQENPGLLERVYYREKWGYILRVSFPGKGNDGSYKRSKITIIL